MGGAGIMFRMVESSSGAESASVKKEAMVSLSQAGRASRRKFYPVYEV